ncbi:MAG: MerR family DNA-binding transcriptional regulator [Euzebyaceae bacterium]|nr:MerR family DNA-binding transcriptional regulator [Euzebyaceae bacterium]
MLGTRGRRAHDARLTIGQFSAVVRLSPKALRLYDRLGLLEPERVDRFTCYRYYALKQAPRARAIALPRSSTWRCRYRRGARGVRCRRRRRRAPALAGRNPDRARRRDDHSRDREDRRGEHRRRGPVHRGGRTVARSAAARTSASTRPWPGQA